MSGPWQERTAPTLDPGHVTVLDGTSFCVSERGGDFTGAGATGLFVRDTRVLSTWVLSVEAMPLELLSVQSLTPFEVLFVSRTRALEHPGSELVVARHRSVVAERLREQVTIHNTGRVTARTGLRLDVDADFADLFDVKEGLEARRSPSGARVVPGGVELAASSGTPRVTTLVRGDPGATAHPGGLTWAATVPPHGTWSTTLEVTIERANEAAAGGDQAPPGPDATPDLPPSAETGRRPPLSAPRLTTEDDALARLLRQSVDDLSMLRLFDPDRPGPPVVAAGAPWFMALFGRDSLLSSLMLLPVDASLAEGTLRTLAAWQGRSHDEVTEEEPGRVLHELRQGRRAALALGGRSAYYGTADATPLFVMLAGALATWHPERFPRSLVPAVDRALAWVTEHGDRDGDGFVEYLSSSPDGLRNQGWKDSWDGISYADGELAEPPIALAEVQGYVYAAYLAAAAIADLVGDSLAAGSRREAAAGLKERFNRAFWLPGRRYFAVGLDAEKHPIDSVTSNVGHCLWTGIVDDDKAGAVAAHLVGPELFTGWGIRTLSSADGAYHPMSYHNGSVWPHDTALCAAGLARYGYAEEAARVALGLVDAAAAFGHRLPELFCGFSRERLPVPVPYPAACSPQAWAAAAPFELLRLLLGVEATPKGLRFDPAVPERLLPLSLDGIRCRGATHRVEVDVSGRPRHRRTPDPREPGAP